MDPVSEMIDQWRMTGEEQGPEQGRAEVAWATTNLPSLAASSNCVICMTRQTKLNDRIFYDFLKAKQIDALRPLSFDSVASKRGTVFAAFAVWTTGMLCE